MSKAKKRQLKKDTISLPNQISWPGLTLIILLGMLLFYPPYFQGLFYKPHMFITHILTSLLLVLVWADKYKRRDFSFITGPLDWAVLAYAAAYALSLINAVVIGEAVYGFLRALNYFMIYWMITQVVKDFKDLQFIMKTIIVSASGVAVIGILAASGLIHYPQAFFDDHIVSTMGYHNTMATLLVAAFLLSTSLLMTEKERWWQLAYSLANYLLMLIIMASVSKGAWLILALGLVLILVGMPRRYRMRLVYFLFATMLPAIIISSYFLTAIAVARLPQAIGLVLAGILLILGGWFLWRYIEPWLERMKPSRPVKTVLISAVLILSILIISQFSVSDRITTEISEITDTQHLSYVTRIDFMRWAADIIQDYPLTGAGAGGWEALYRQYQEYYFTTKQVHSHIFQLGVEAGLAGILAFISMWVIFLYLIYKLYLFQRGREEQEEWTVIWGIAVAALVLGAHSCFDFDLSVPAMIILLWSLLALISTLYRNCQYDSRHKAGKPLINIGICAVLVLIMFLCGLRFLLAFQQAQNGKEKMLAAQVDMHHVQMEMLYQAGDYFARAVKNDPLNAEYRSYMAIQQGTMYQIFKGQEQSQALVFREQSIQDARRALDLDSYNFEMNKRLMQNLFTLGDTEGLIRTGRSYIWILPNDPEAYQIIADLWWDISQKCEASGQYELALEFAAEIIDLENKFEQQRNKVQLDHPLWQGKRLVMTPEMEKIFGQARDFIATANKQNEW